jgi:hypothetical protein
MANFQIIEILLALGVKNKKNLVQVQVRFAFYRH